MFAHEGSRFLIAPVAEGWLWSIRTLTGEVLASGVAPSKAVAAACVVGATLCGLPRERFRTAEAADATEAADFGQAA